MRSTLLILSTAILLANGECTPASAPGGPSPSEGAIDVSPEPEPAACAPVRVLRCGDTVVADNGDWNDGATDVMDFYAGAIGNYRGPELVYRLEVDAPRTATLRFVDPEPSVLNHDLFVLAGHCSAESATARGFNSLEFDAWPGEQTFVVVDGFDGAVGPFELAVDCGEPLAPTDPFAPQHDTAEGLVNVSDNLEELMEFDLLRFACDDWEANPDDRAALLACGKHRFFYEPMGTDGIPEPLLDWVGRNFPDFAGPAYTGFGLVQDPFADQPRALGFGYTDDFGGTPALGMTCASCHFGQLPDGRFAVGYPNHRYDYGAHMLSLMVGVKAGIPGFNPEDHHPDAVAVIQPMIDRFQADPMLGMSLMWNMAPLLTSLGDIPEVPYEAEGQYASWRDGTMDFLIAPLTADDGVHTVSRTSPLWGIPSEEEAAESGAPHAMLGWTGETRSIEDFARGFVHVGGGDLAEWPDAQLEPLAEYVKSLRAPELLNPAHPIDIDRGRAVFDDGGCLDCHAGPRGGGQRIFDWAEIGTDDTLALWGAPDGDGGLCCGLDDYDNAYDTGGVKAPRLVGLHTFERFLHNGALDSLEQLLCLEARPAGEVPPFAAGGHTFGCDLPEVDRRALIDFLDSL